ncbi:MAG: hypothetical protein IPP53_11390 [Bacteroidetes bacterium]|nr:hypothetical protein [Bacteroidota bacterium]
MISNTVFYKFVANERSKNTFVSIEDSQLKFIMDYEIDYIEIDKKTKLPPKIQLLVKEGNNKSSYWRSVFNFRKIEFLI